RDDLEGSGHAACTAPSDGRVRRSRVTLDAPPIFRRTLYEMTPMASRLTAPVASRCRTAGAPWAYVPKHQDAARAVHRRRDGRGHPRCGAAIRTQDLGFPFAGG